MDKFKIRGGQSLSGTVTISGAKNAALPILMATVLPSDKVTLSNVPNLHDVDTTLELLDCLGVTHRRVGETAVCIDPTTLNHFKAPYELVKTMRASILVLVSLVYKHVQVMKIQVKKQGFSILNLQFSTPRFKIDKTFEVEKLTIFTDTLLKGLNNASDR